MAGADPVLGSWSGRLIIDADQGSCQYLVVDADPACGCFYPAG